MDKVLFLISAFLLVWGLRLQSDPASASKGNRFAAVGMLIAIISAIIMPIENSSDNYAWIFIPIVLSASIGYIIAKKIETLFDMRPAAIVERFKLKDPIYSETAAYGHMGRKSEKKTIKFEVGGGKVISRNIETFPWEKLDRVDEIRSNFGL